MKNRRPLVELLQAEASTLNAWEQAQVKRHHKRSKDIQVQARTIRHNNRRVNGGLEPEFIEETG